MNRYLTIIIFLASCQTRDVEFEFEVMKSQSGILIKDFKPMPRNDFNEILFLLNDSLKMDSINIYLLAEDISRINPEFKKKYYRGYMGQMDLASFDNDTTKALRNLRLGMGTFKRGAFIKDDEYDEKLLNNQFFVDSDK